MTFSSERDLGPVFEATTSAVRVGVRTQYLDDQSRPDEGLHVWAYFINIVNEGEAPVQLINRYWHITDAKGVVQEVRGEGVVGEQPTIKPGDEYRYVSGTPLNSASGFMRGNYEMLSEEGALFSVEIPTFSLDDPHQIKAVN